MKTLAIETSCDDTSLAIVREENGAFFVDKMLAYSQIQDHQKYGGVVPEIAFRLHSEQIVQLLAHFIDDIPTLDRISVTTTPGLAWSLLIWKTIAHILARQFDKPLIEVNHIYWHVFSLLLERNIAELPFPWVVLTASGGHNEIYVVEKKAWNSDRIDIVDLEITKLWKTLDDAAGECFDKVARMLWWPYPGGQWISEKALLWRPNKDFHFKRILMSEHLNHFDFSFSWMKSQAYNVLQKLDKQWIVVEWQVLYDIAYEFQQAIVDILTHKLLEAAQQYNAQTVGIVWWVSASDSLFAQASSEVQTHMGKTVLRPVKKVYSTDNGAMIGVVWLLSAISPSSLH
jgi:N6-L-threonylcarbamoyladenine synthase